MEVGHGAVGRSPDVALGRRELDRTEHLPEQHPRLLDLPLQDFLQPRHVPALSLELGFLQPDGLWYIVVQLPNLFLSATEHVLEVVGRGKPLADG